MNTAVEIDKAGRIVVPKKMRDSLHLVPGTRLLVSQEGEVLTLRHESSRSGLYKKCGLWVHRGSDRLTVDEVREAIDAGRAVREEKVIREEETS